MSDAPLWHLDRDDGFAEQDEIDVELRSAVEIRTRILILASVLRRLALEAAPPDGDGEPIAEAFDEREWLREHGLAFELTPREAALLDSPLGSIAPEATIEASWQGEALVVLGWAIGAGDAPSVNGISDPRPVIDIVPRPWDAIQDWLSEPGTVSESEVVRHREVAEIWHWRMTTEVLRRSGSAADSQDFEEAIRDVAAEALDVGLVPSLRDGDLSVRGRRIKELSGDDIEELVAVTGQRLHALNWLCGFGNSWDDVPLDI
jgi:hypothetical protein